MKIRTNHSRSWLYTAVVVLLFAATGSEKGNTGPSGPMDPVRASGSVPADLPDLSGYMIPTYALKYVLTPGTQMAYNKNIDLRNDNAVKAACRITDQHLF